MASASGSGSSPESPWSRRAAATSDPWKSPERDPQGRWGRAAARTLPTMVGTGCRPSAASPRLGGIGSTPERAAVTGASGPALSGVPPPGAWAAPYEGCDRKWRATPAERPFVTGLGRPWGKATGGLPRPPGPVAGRAGWKPALRRQPPPPCPPLGARFLAGAWLASLAPGFSRVSRGSPPTNRFNGFPLRRHASR